MHHLRMNAPAAGSRWCLDGGPPRVPTLMPDLPDDRQRFADIKGLARKVSRMRRGRGIVITPGVEVVFANRPFPVLNIAAIEFDGSETHLAAAAIQTGDREVLMRALEAVDPQGGAD